MFRYFNRGLTGAIRQTGIHGRRVAYAGAISGVAGYLYFNNMSSLGRAQIHNDAIIPPVKVVSTKYNTVTTDVIDKLRSALGEENVITDKEVIQGSVNSQWSYLVDLPPSVIVTPSNTEDVVKIVNVARDNHIPIISRSAGTSLEGHCSAESGGIMIDFEQRMANVLEVYPDDLQVRVQPGVKWVELNEHLEEIGLNLFFPLDPSPGAAIGGMLSTGCSGTNACMYGTARGEWFVNITVVMPNGKVMKTRQRAKKSSAGIDMTKLFVGAEGTLGVITELTLRLAPKVPTSVAVAPFDSIEDAAKGVAKVIQSGISVNCAELLDDLAIIANNNSGSTYKKYEEKPHIFFKFAGTQAHMAEDAERTAAIVKEFGSKLEYAENDDEAKNLWEARKWGLANIASMVPNSRIWTTDVCVPQSKLPTLVKQIKSDAVEAGIYAPLLSHCADGNAHFLLAFKDDKEREVVEHLVEKMVERAQALDGTCTGEHSVGVGKKHHLVHELGEETVRALWTLKNAFDPDNIMNPGKLYPDIDTRH
ncbi:FAD-binding domain-containing protein [Wallemia mellicola]|nr:hypothetical protein E3Q24_02590 [Wallemia mellicola]TIB85453.1 FAD-binding domain-containing protein [Wallemia mellicola]TIB88616.1 FAD-binding domain-containing protein [Wallemia mellicola]TIC35627.1 FAD-binding domain-containing protein [Wallemia mellicola]TIC40789.1 FAD-binding domain-containing protein [Wallemia mellicola]